MLILTRRKDESIILFTAEHGPIKVQVLAMEGSNVRLGIDAPPEVGVDREEIFIKKMLNGEVGGNF